MAILSFSDIFLIDNGPLANSMESSRRISQLNIATFGRLRGMSLFVPFSDPPCNEGSATLGRESGGPSRGREKDKQLLVEV